MFNLPKNGFQLIYVTNILIDIKDGPSEITTLKIHFLKC